MTLCGREGNRWSGIALAMRYSLSNIPTNGLSGLGKGDEHPTYVVEWRREIYLVTAVKPTGP